MASEKINAIVEELKTLSVLELSELVHAVEDEFGVSAAAAVVAGPAAAGPAVEEKTEFDVILKSAGAQVLDLLRQRLLLTAHRRLLRKALLRTRLRTSRLSSRKSAQRSNSSKFVSTKNQALGFFPGAFFCL